MKKLISNRAARTIQEKHSKEEIENGIITLFKVSENEIISLLKQKLLEEVNEYLFSNDEEELQDIELICREIRKPKYYSEGWVLINTRGHQQNKKEENKDGK